MNSKPLLLWLAVTTAGWLHAADDAPTQPAAAKPLRTCMDFLAVIPKDLEPENARNWSDAQKEVANGLFKKKLIEPRRPAQMRFKVRGVDFWGRFVVWSYLPNDEGYHIRVFASQWKDESFFPKLATLREGDLIEMTGICDLAKFENLWNSRSLSLGIGEASFIKLLPNGKPAPAPKPIPVHLISAVYGSGTTFIDVTDRVKSLLNEPEALFKVNPQWLGASPASSGTRALVIVHEIDGKRRITTLAENEEVSPALVVK